jgi:uncharacterized protein (TIGR02246 family)
MNRISCLLLLTCAVLGCLAIDRRLVAATANEETAIRRLVDRWEKLYLAHDVSGLAKLYTSDCVRMPEGASTTIGREALAKAYKDEFAITWQAGATVTLKIDEVVVSGDYAFARGTDRIANTGEKDYVGKWMATFRREKNGEWKFFWSTYNGNEPAKSNK